ncbi:methyl-accepting chemotaxis protein [Paenibacillus xylaniclasticus]|uniref:methyl-accepting chemotaxis protein n=1 Tax=Paenibacillus xylaniclasticus TaxID=588083 RepID=UPI000FD9A6C4|nr:MULTISPECIES: methyl-accepting chemotaxis protein [Paenibacillus]GFN30457.1 methyl-accepting chemotaxis protein [Paenibacillus curdlanolyticus]
MSWIRNMKISSKLISAFVIVSLMAGCMGVFGIVNMKDVDKDYKNLYKNFGLSLGDLGSAGIDFNGIRVRLALILLTNDNNKKQGIVDEIKKMDVEMQDYLRKFNDTISMDNAQEKYDSLQKSLEQYNVLRDKVIDLSLNGKNDKAIELIMTDGISTASEANNNMLELFDIRKSNGSNLSNELSAKTDSTSVMMIVIVILLVLASIGFGIFISRTISNPVRKLVESANKIADGDLNVVIDIDTKDEIGGLASAFKRMSANLNETMSNIQTASEQVATGAKHISMLSTTLSQGSTEQASSVQQLTASIEEIASQTRQNADSSNEANELAEAAKQNAILGNTQMKEMLNAMDEINTASQNISKIIKVIDEIAFQTNILALNAAVEAARAGQHGKGFAVVAEEVRNLAARSANAAKETTELIEGSIKKAEGGTKIAKDTAEALHQIVDDVAKVATLVNNIATASNEQAIGINQINQGIMQVSQVVQSSSASLEEGAATSEELSSQADLLKEQVNRFKLRKGQAGSYQAIEDISPELLQLFEKMSHKKAKSHAISTEEELVQQTKIDLSDNEFGKY